MLRSGLRIARLIFYSVSQDVEWKRSSALRGLKCNILVESVLNTCSSCLLAEPRKRDFSFVVLQKFRSLSSPFLGLPNLF